MRPPLRAAQLACTVQSTLMLITAAEAWGGTAPCDATVVRCACRAPVLVVARVTITGCMAAATTATRWKG